MMWYLCGTDVAPILYVCGNWVVVLLYCCGTDVVLLWYCCCNVVSMLLYYGLVLMCNVVAMSLSCMWHSCSDVVVLVLYWCGDGVAAGSDSEGGCQLHNALLDVDLFFLHRCLPSRLLAPSKLGSYEPPCWADLGLFRIQPSPGRARIQRAAANDTMHSWISTSCVRACVHALSLIHI